MSKGPKAVSRFTHRNEPFTCEACDREVAPRSPGCRNHCPHCLVSKHVDEFPGDRANECQGLMDAVGYELDPKKGIMLHYLCRKCRAKTRNMAAPDDAYDRILALSTTPRY